MKPIYFLLISVLAVCNQLNATTRIIDPNSGTQSQVNAAQPGDTLLFAPGTHDNVTISNLVSTECDPLVLMSQDPNNPATIFGGANGNSYRTFFIEYSAYVIVENLIILGGTPNTNAGGLYGLDISFSDHIIVRDCEISYTRQEGMKVRNRSSYVDIVNNTIHHTGRGDERYGEGIYAGTASYNSNPDLDCCDSTRYLWIEGNEFYECGKGEAIDLKPWINKSTVINNTVHDITLGHPNQSNIGAITMWSSDAGANNWAIGNNVYDIYFGDGPSDKVGGAAFVSHGGGNHITGNTIGQVEEAGFVLRDSYNKFQDHYVWDNVFNSTTGVEILERQIDDNNIKLFAPSYAHPFVKQSWCGDVKNNCPVPILGDAQSLCGIGSILLDAGHSPDGVVTYEWFLDGVSQGAAATSANTLSVSEAGSWSVEIDSGGVCSNSSTVTISAEIADFDLGADDELCQSLTIDLEAGDYNANYDYSWKKDNQALMMTTHSITVEEAGVYEASVSAIGCATKSDMIIITSGLPMVTGDVLCETGVAFFETGGSMASEWYDAAVDGNLMATGTTFSPSITQNTTYYVQDGSSAVTYYAGRREMINQWNSDDFTKKKLVFTTEKVLTINSVDIDAASNQTVHVRILADDMTTVLYDIDQEVTAGFHTITLGVTLDPGTYYMDGLGSTGQLGYENEQATPPVSYGYADYTIDGVISFASQEAYEAGWENTNARWRYFYNWEISVGASCARVPVAAVIDPNDASCVIASKSGLRVSSSALYPNPTSGVVYLDVAQEYTVTGIKGKQYLKGVGGEIDLTELDPGLYFIHLGTAVHRITRQ